MFWEDLYRRGNEFRSIWTINEYKNHTSFPVKTKRSRWNKNSEMFTLNRYLFQHCGQGLYIVIIVIWQITSWKNKACIWLQHYDKQCLWQSWGNLQVPTFKETGERVKAGKGLYKKNSSANQCCWNFVPTLLLPQKNVQIVKLIWVSVAHSGLSAFITQSPSGRPSL